MENPCHSCFLPANTEWLGSRLWLICAMNTVTGVWADWECSGHQEITHALETFYISVTPDANASHLRRILYCALNFKLGIYWSDIYAIQCLQVFKSVLKVTGHNVLISHLQDTKNTVLHCLFGTSAKKKIFKKIFFFICKAFSNSQIYGVA